MSHTIKHPLPIYVWIVEWTANVFKTEKYLHPRRSTHPWWSTHSWWSSHSWRPSHPRRHAWCPKRRHSHRRTHSWRHAHWTARWHAHWSPHGRTHRPHARWASHARRSSHAHGRRYCIARVLPQLAAHECSSGGVNQGLGLKLRFVNDRSQTRRGWHMANVNSPDPPSTSGSRTSHSPCAFAPHNGSSGRFRQEKHKITKSSFKLFMNWVHVGKSDLE